MPKARSAPTFSNVGFATIADRLSRREVVEEGASAIRLNTVVRQLPKVGLVCVRLEVRSFIARTSEKEVRARRRRRFAGRIAQALRQARMAVNA